MAFVRGERTGLDRLQRVLPSIFKTFTECDPEKVLLECGLTPCPSFDGHEFPTFYFDPLKDGREMIAPDAWKERKRHARPSKGTHPPSSEELLCAYADVSSSWGSPRSSSNS